MSADDAISSEALLQRASELQAQADALAAEAHDLRVEGRAAAERERMADPAYATFRRAQEASWRAEAEAAVRGARPVRLDAKRRNDRHLGSTGVIVRIGGGRVLELFGPDERDDDTFSFHEVGPRGGWRDGSLPVATGDAAALGEFLRGVGQEYVDVLHAHGTVAHRDISLPSGSTVTVGFRDGCIWIAHDRYPPCHIDAVALLPLAEVLENLRTLDRVPLEPRDVTPPAALTPRPRM